MLEKIINSHTRLAILACLFNDPGRRYYARELVKALDLDPANVHKELASLVQGGFVKEEKSGRQKFFSTDQASPFFIGLKEIFSHYRSNAKQLEFFCLEEMPNYYPMMVAIAWDTGLANNFFRRYGLKRRFSHLLSAYDNNLCQLLAPKGEFLALGQEILEKVMAEPGWAEKLLADLDQAEAKLYQASEKLKQRNLKRLSDKELAEVFSEYYAIYTQLHIFHWLHTASDFGDNVFSKHLMAYLSRLIKGRGYSLGDVFSTLTTPTKEAKPMAEYRSLMELLRYARRQPKLGRYLASTETRIVAKDLRGVDAALDKRLDEHVEAFGWLGYGTVGPAWGREYFLDILGSFLRQEVDPDKMLREIDTKRKDLGKRQQALSKELGISSDYARAFQFARDLVFTKGTRKDSMFHSYCIIENLFREIGSRRYLSVRQVRYLYPEEFKSLLLSKNFQTAVLNERHRFSLFYSSASPAHSRRLEGEAARRFLSSLSIIREEIGDVSILQGDCASPGRVRGQAKVINAPAEMVKMNVGDVLVSIATTPDLVPAIKKASAIVTDVGGITCHAAIISRELGIPCVVGTRIATKVVKDGTVLDVNATHGKINIIKDSK